MRRAFSAFALLTILLLAVTALPQPGTAQPLPQGASQNALVDKAQAAIDAKRWPDAEAVLKQLLASDPRWEYFDALGVAQFNQGRYEDSIASYQRAIDLGQKTAAPAAVGQMLTSIGNANLKLKKNDAAIAAYTKAAAISPNPAVAYYNLCATLYNMGKVEAQAVAACDKAIAADPKRADAYFIKGSILFALGTIEKNGKFKVSEASVQALKQYLVLTPNGPHAADIKAMLDAAK